MSWLAKNIPAAPAGFDRDQFFAGIRWHQKWQLFRGIFTPGNNPIEEMCDDLTLPRNLTGKRVLDVGAWHGCLSFECERRGAREVVALSPEDPEAAGFHRLREVLHSHKVHYVRGTIYDLNPRQLGHFDVVLCCGVVYHLRYPLLGIDNLRRVCKGDVYIETVVSDAQLMLPEGQAFKKVPMAEISPALLSVPLWQFYRFEEMNGDPSNWFGPNCVAVVQAFESAGFETRLLKKSNRATFHGKVKKGLPEFLTIGTVEGVYYDTVASHLLGTEELGEGLWSATVHGRSFSVQFQCAVLSSKEYYRQNGNNDGAWVSSLYARLLGQTAAPPGADLPLRRVFDDDRAYRQAVLEHILSSTEYRVYLVVTYYATYLGRPPGPAEIGHWLGMLKRGASPEFLQAEFLASDEFFQNQGGSNPRWLDQVYARLLDKRSTSERNTFLEALEAKTTTRAGIVSAILESLAYRHRLMQITYSTFLNSQEEASHSFDHLRPSAA